MQFPPFDPRLAFSLPDFRIPSALLAPLAFGDGRPRPPSAWTAPSVDVKAHLVPRDLASSFKQSSRLKETAPLLAASFARLSNLSSDAFAQKALESDRISKTSTPKNPANSTHVDHQKAMQALESVFELYQADEPSARETIIGQTFEESTSLYANRISGTARSQSEIKSRFQDLRTHFKTVTIRPLSPPIVVSGSIIDEKEVIPENTLPAGLTAWFAPMGPAEPLLDKDEGKLVSVAVDTEQAYYFKSRTAAFLAGSEKLVLKTRLVVSLDRETGKVRSVRDVW